MDSVLVNLLLFPLVGGYYITTRLEESKYIGQRRSSQTVLFNAIIVGIPLLVVSLVITTTITLLLPQWVDWIKVEIFPIQNKFLGTCFLSYILAIVGTKLRNKYINKTEAIYSAIGEVGNELEILLSESCKQGGLVMLSLKNDKVYVGWVEVYPEPSACPYIHIIPFLSGYRDEKKEVQMTTTYHQVYYDLIRTGRIKQIKDSGVNLIIQSNEIISAGRFDFDIWESFRSAARVDEPKA